MKIIRRVRRSRQIDLGPVKAPTGAIIGRVVLQDGRRIFDRRVRERMRFRELDGWAIGADALAQIVRWHVETVRYRADEGAYETSLSFFLANATLCEFDATRNPEPQHILPRGMWPVRPAAPVQEITSPVGDTAAPTSGGEPRIVQLDLFADVDRERRSSLEGAVARAGGGR